MMASLDGLIQLDQHITLWINNLSTPFLDPVWKILSDNLIWFPFYALVMAVLLRNLGWKKGLVVILSLFLCVWLTDQLANLFKYGVGRLRPCYNSWMVGNGLYLPYGNAGRGLFGFYSAHASNTFGFAICSWLGFRLNDPRKVSYKGYGIGVCCWALLVSLSRVMLSAHFFGDILIGTIFGLLLGAAIAFFAHWLINRLACGA